MICVATIQTAPHGQLAVSPPHPDMPGQSALCEPAQSMSNGQSRDGLPSIIQSYASRGRFRSGVERQRFIDKTLILSRGA